MHKLANFSTTQLIFIAFLFILVQYLIMYNIMYQRTAYNISQQYRIVKAVARSHNMALQVV